MGFCMLRVAECDREIEAQLESEPKRGLTYQCVTFTKKDGLAMALTASNKVVTMKWRPCLRTIRQVAQPPFWFTLLIA